MSQPLQLYQLSQPSQLSQPTQLSQPSQPSQKPSQLSQPSQPVYDFSVVMATLNQSIRPSYIRTQNPKGTDRERRLSYHFEPIEQSLSDTMRMWAREDLVTMQRARAKARERRCLDALRFGDSEADIMGGGRRLSEVDVKRAVFCCDRCWDCANCNGGRKGPS